MGSRCEFEHEGSCIVEVHYKRFKCPHAKKNGFLFDCTAKEEDLVDEEEYEELLKKKSHRKP